MADASVLVETTPYDAIGGAAGVRRLVERFYDLMDSDPAVMDLRTMHEDDLGPVRDRLFEFRSGWLSGPALYFRNPNTKCIRSAHAPFAIDNAMRDQWMHCMRMALNECSLPGDLRSQVEVAFLRLADSFRNR